MKLMYCPHCEDIVRLMMWSRQCICGNAKGRYVDENTVCLKGDAIPIGINTDQFETNTQKGEGDMDCWVIQKDCETVRRL